MTHTLSVLAAYDPLMAPEQREASKPSTSSVLREKALTTVGAAVFLGVIVGITLWLEADVLHEQTSGDGLGNLVMVAVVVVLAAAAAAVAGLAQGVRGAMRWIRRRRDA
jgi:hypothetical protein